MSEENEKNEVIEADKTQYSDEALAAEAWFVYSRPVVDAALAEEAFTPFGELPEDERERWRRVACHMDNLIRHGVE